MKALEFPRHLEWLNVRQNLQMNDLKGYVVLFDFWTYCCINCIHVLKDLAWLEHKYKDEPFVVIGIHSPKFDNEKIKENVLAAVKRYDIQHPVVLDNQRETWESYGISAWPTLMVIGADGRIIGWTSGEGKRETLDQIITKALVEGRQKNILADSFFPYSQKDKPNTLFYFPSKLEYMKERETLFVSDSNNHRLIGLKITGFHQAEITEVIGAGQPGRLDGSFDKASFDKPQGLSSSGHFLYVCDTENHMIREVDLEERTVSTIIGTGHQAEYRETGGYAPYTSLNSPWDCLYKEGKLYIAMAGSHQLWVHDFESNQIGVFAGNGYENIVDGPADMSCLAQPSGLAMDNTSLYFADSEVSAIRSVRFTDKTVETLIGKGLFVFGHQDGSWENALLQHALGLTYYENKIYVADTYNHAVRVLDLETQTISTLIGRDQDGFCLINGTRYHHIQPFCEPNDILCFGTQLYITDTNHHAIKVFDLKTHTLDNLDITNNY